MNVKDSAQALVEQQAQDKLAAIGDLVASHEALETARAAVGEAEAGYRDHRQNALNHGWSETELRKVGLRPLTVKKRRRTTRPKSTMAEPASNAMPTSMEGVERTEDG